MPSRPFRVHVSWRSATVAYELSEIAGPGLTVGVAMEYSVSQKGGGDGQRSAEDPDHGEFADLVRRQLAFIGEDPEREGLRATPERVARSLTWLTRAYDLDVADAVSDAVCAEAHDNMV